MMHIVLTHAHVQLQLFGNV